MTEDNITSTSTKYPENETATSNSTLAGVGFPGDEVLQLLVPYVALTIFLLILAALSFARFHRTRVAQNRQRLEAIADHLEKEQRISIVMEKECGSPGTVKQIWIIWITWRRNSANLSGSTRLSWWGEQKIWNVCINWRGLADLDHGGKRITNLDHLEKEQRISIVMGKECGLSEPSCGKQQIWITSDYLEKEQEIRI